MASIISPTTASAPDVSTKNTFTDTALGGGNASQSERLRVAEAIINAISSSQAVIEFEPDGTIIVANDIFLSAMGYTLAEVQGKHHRMFVEPAYAHSTDYGDFWHRVGSGEFQAGEYKRVAKNGDAVWIQATYSPIFDASGNVTKVIKFATDITAQKKQQAEYQGQIDAIGKSQAVIEFELDGTIVTANDLFLNAVGYRLDEIQGKHHSVFAEPGVAESPEYKEFWNALRRGEYQTGDYKRIGKAGNDVWIQASYNPILDTDGNPFKIVKYAVDRTERVNERLRRETASQKIAGDLQKINDQVIHAGELVLRAAASADQTSNSVGTVASAVEQMSASIREISAQSGRATSVSENAVLQNEASNKAIASLSESAEKIGDVVKLINDIASQTNLLALNATIEAARAGEAGKGFAVVASEVKNLANQTARATEEIGAQIQSVQASTEQSVKAIGEVSATIEEINSISASISAAVEEQSAVTGEISMNMRQTSESVEAIAENSKEISSAIEHVKTAIEQVKEASSQIV